MDRELAKFRDGADLRQMAGKLQEAIKRGQTYEQEIAAAQQLHAHEVICICVTTLNPKLGISPVPRQGGRRESPQIRYDL